MSRNPNRLIMSNKICQGVFGKLQSLLFFNPTGKLTSRSLAINKPKSISSAQVLRELQNVFNPSKFFASWIETKTEERAWAARTDRKQRRRLNRGVEVKLGHGGTLDPMATGVLVVGVGEGTKHLQSFLECTKAYEATVLFGATTDTYDILGKVLAKAPYGHVTEAAVKDALQHFRGKIMQKPPLYSALRVQGKRLYEYAREGKEVPVEIQERPVEVTELELVEWMGGEDHSYEWRAEDADAGEMEKKLGEKLLNLSEVAIPESATAQGDDVLGEEFGNQRKRPRDGDDELVKDVPPSKRVAPNPKHSMTGALPSPDELPISETFARNEVKAEIPLCNDESNRDSKPSPSSSHIPPRPPAVKLHMTVTSGFYVRSLSHDLGKSVGSLGAMSELVRTRQGGFTLGKNVLEYEDLSKGEDVWAPKIERMLGEWDCSLGEDGGGGGGRGMSPFVAMGEEVK